MTADDETFVVCGPREINKDLQAVAGLIISEDGTIQENPIARAVNQDARYVVVINRDNEKTKQIVSPDKNPALLASRVVQILLGHERKTLDPIRPIEKPASTSQRLDVDQEAAYDAALAGLDIVIHGPPGTGKSEVIAAIARTALDCGRRVLIAAETPSALNVARRRLKATGHLENNALAIETSSSFTDRPRDEPAFDLLLVDEGTRMTLARTMILASRARQIVILGDDRQMLPPDGKPDLYRRALKLGLPAFGLHRHYRSQDPRLIWFSNMFSYDLALKTVPSPKIDPHSGPRLIYIPCPKIETRDGKTVNVSECAAIVKELLAHAQNKDQRSICVITTTNAQKDAIRQSVRNEFERSNLDPELLSPNPDEKFFVWTTEEIQGEERDITLISMTFAPTNGLIGPRLGQFSHINPLNRLNVMMSRARIRSVVYCSFTRENIDTAGEMADAQALFYVLHETLTAINIADLALPVYKMHEAFLEKYRHPKDILVNLGVLHGWKSARSNDYALGLVYRDQRLNTDTWDAAIAQLKSTGWPIVDFDEFEIRNHPDAIFSRIEKALERHPQTYGRALP